MNINDFDSLLKTSYGMLNQYLEKQNRRIREQGNLIVLASSNRDRDIKAALGNPESGILALSPNMKKAMQRDDRYAYISRNLQNQSCFLSDLSRDRICNILKRFLLFENVSDVHYSAKLLEECTEIIYYWYHSEDFRRQYDNLLPQNESGYTTILEDYLLGTNQIVRRWGNWDKLYNALVTIQEESKVKGKSLVEWMRDQYPVLSEDTVERYSEMTEKMHLLQDRFQKSDSIYENTGLKSRVEKLEKTVARINDDNLAEEEISLFDKIYDNCKWALNNADVSALEVGIDMLDYFCQMQLQERKVTDQNWKYWEDAFLCAKECTILEDRIAERQSVRKGIKENFIKAKERVNKLRLAGKSEESDVMVHTKREALMDHDQISFLTSLLNRDISLFQELRTSLVRLRDGAKHSGEIAYDNLKDYDIVQLVTNYYNAIPDGVKKKEQKYANLLIEAATIIARDTEDEKLKSEIEAIEKEPVPKVSSADEMQIMNLIKQAGQQICKKYSNYFK